MGIRYSEPESAIKHKNIRFKESRYVTTVIKTMGTLASGIEYGAAAHNPFYITGSCINVAPEKDEEYYRKAQVELCGSYAVVDRYGTLEDTPADDNEFDYSLSSHVFEHSPNPIRALLEMQRVVRVGGLHIMIVPQRNALPASGNRPADADRPLTEWTDWIEWYEADYSVDEHPLNEKIGAGSHYSVYTSSLLAGLIKMAGESYGVNWERVGTVDPDDKVGNGFLLAYRQLDKPAPKKKSRKKTKKQAEVIEEPDDAFNIEDAIEEAISIEQQEELVLEEV